MQLNPPTKQFKKNQRNRTHRRSFRHRVIEHWGLNCFYCSRRLVDADMMPKSHWIELSEGKLRWKMRNGTEVISYCLTLEHLLPISRGGESTIENVVPCCHECNQKKARLLNNTRRRYYCRCGLEKRGHQKRCDACRVRYTIITHNMHVHWMFRPFHLFTGTSHEALQGRDLLAGR